MCGIKNPQHRSLTIHAIFFHKNEDAMNPFNKMKQ